MTIHRRRGGRYWYHWLIIVGGAVLAVAAIATDMVGIGGGY